MKRIILGIVLGIFIFLLFLYLGGPEFLKKLGQRTEEAGIKLEKYEKELKEGVEKAKEAVEETREDTAKEADKTLRKTKEKMKETYEETKEKVKEYITE